MSDVDSFEFSLPSDTTPRCSPYSREVCSSPEPKWKRRSKNHVFDREFHKWLCYSSSDDETDFSSVCSEEIEDEVRNNLSPDRMFPRIVDLSTGEEIRFWEYREARCRCCETDEDDISSEESKNFSQESSGGDEERTEEQKLRLYYNLQLLIWYEKQRTITNSMRMPFRNMELDYRRAAELLFSAENPRLTYLGIFFSVEKNMQQILPLFSKKKKIVSKTLIEWTIIKLAKLIPLEFEWNGQRINIGDEYTLFRSQGTKEHSDPFARRPRLNAGTKGLNVDNIKFDFLYDQKDVSKSIETTEAQLTFFKWIIVRGILDYIQKHVGRLNQLYTIYSTLKKQTNNIRMTLEPSNSDCDGIERNITIYTGAACVARGGQKRSELSLKQSTGLSKKQQSSAIIKQTQLGFQNQNTEKITIIVRDSI